MAEAKQTAADKAAAEKAAERVAAEEAAAREADRRAAEESAAAVEATKDAEAAEVDRVNTAAQEAHAAEEATRANTKALALAKQLEGFVETNGQDVFDEALYILMNRQDAVDEARGVDRKVAARQRREAKADQGATPAGRTTPEKKVG